MSQDILNTAEARIMRLRGYGNAIVAPFAQAFIEASMGALNIPRTPAAGTSAGLQPERKHMSDEQTQQPETKSTAKRKAAQRHENLPLFSVPVAQIQAQAPQGAPKALTKAQQLREALRARQADVKRTGDALRATTKALKGFLKTANTEHAQLLRAENLARKAWDKAVAAAEKAKSKLNGVA